MVESDPGHMQDLAQCTSCQQETALHCSCFQKPLRLLLLQTMCLFRPCARRMSPSSEHFAIVLPMSLLYSGEKSNGQYAVHTCVVNEAACTHLGVDDSIKFNRRKTLACRGCGPSCRTRYEKVTCSILLCERSSKLCSRWLTG